MIRQQVQIFCRAKLNQDPGLGPLEPLARAEKEATTGDTHSVLCGDERKRKMERGNEARRPAERAAPSGGEPRQVTWPGKDEVELTAGGIPLGETPPQWVHSLLNAMDLKQCIQMSTLSKGWHRELTSSCSW